MQQMFFIADLIVCSTCFGHHYAHHQGLENVIQLVVACGLWCLVFKLSVWCGAEGYVTGLRAVHLPTCTRNNVHKYRICCHNNIIKKMFTFLTRDFS